MRILLLTPDITPKGVKRTYNTGFSLMVDQIARALNNQGNEVYVSASSFFHPKLGKELTGYEFLSRYLWDIIIHSKLKDWIKAIRYFFTTQKIKYNLRYKIAKYIISTGYNEFLIQKVQPDVISIHSLMPATFPFIQAALRQRIPFVITLHGVFSFIHPCFNTYMEQNILKLLIKNGAYVTFVSSGCRERIAKCHGFLSENMKVVLNSLPQITFLPNCKSTIDCILSIGNLSEQKNQIQILRAYSLLPMKYREKHTLCFIGKDGMKGKIQKEVENLGLKNYVIFTGTLSRPEVYCWINKSSLIVLASKNEGFGLSLIEGFRFGVPSVCFSDIDAYKDIESKDALIGVNERSDKALAEGIEKALSFPWNKELIIKHADHFTDEIMAQSYKTIFTQSSQPDITDKDFSNWLDKYILHSYDFDAN